MVSTAMTTDDDFDRPEAANRLLKAREAAGHGSARDAAMTFGWNVSTYGAHENGRNGFKADSAQKYGAAFGVRWQWLLTGDGEMQSGLAPVTPIKSAAPSNKGPSVPLGAPAPGLIPVLGRAAAGEPGKILMLDGEPSEWITCPPELVGVDGAYATYVYGDSMEPRYFNGERVYVHPIRPSGPRDFVVAQVRDENDDLSGYVKRLVVWDEAGLTLHQFNPDTDLEFTPDKVDSVHVIVGSGRG